MIIPNEVTHRSKSSGLNFTKMVAQGNDFVVIDQRHHSSIKKPGLFASEICNRKYGTGADGLLILEKSRIADIRMRIFNPDGSEPNMCGNGIRCVGLWLKSPPRAQFRERREKIISIETKAGIIEAEINKDKVKIKVSEPKDIRLGLPIKITNRKIKVNFINTGVPHAVIFVEGLDKIDIVNIGRQIRFHKKFQPQGTNVDFVQVIDDNNIKLRTYERGVEEETLACGTGAVAAALIFVIGYRLPATRKINVHTRSGEVLRVEFNKVNDKFKDIWLEGRVRIVYKGTYNV